MSHAHLLRAGWLREQLALGLALLPEGGGLALWIDGAQVAGAGAAVPDEASAAALRFPVVLDHREIGSLLLSPPGAAGEGCGRLLQHALQGMLKSEQARRAVAGETIRAYREMAALQRAVGEFNRSLRPDAVAAALLGEFDDARTAGDMGAVFLHDDEGGLHLAQTFGDAAAAVFGRLRDEALFAEMLARPAGNIANQLAESPAWTPRLEPLRALLWLPLVAHGNCLGWLVLGATDGEGFSAADLKRGQVLASVAAGALRNAQLYMAEKAMFDSFVRVIATAIDAKSPYTAGHCRRVPEIALMIAEAAHRAEDGPLARFRLDDDERTALEIAAMLHDCGKVVTPEWVVDKASKLDAIVNRIELIALRFEILRRDAGERARQELDDDFAFLEKCNRGGESMDPEQLARLRRIAGRRWRDAGGEERPLLTENEVYNLSTQRGTLNPEERKIIEDHAVHTINMLSQIAFPRHLRRIVDYAGGHHERMDGKGYPHGLDAARLPVPARILAIADIFEALTAPDRPYRQSGGLDWAIGVMRRMKDDGHIDGDLFDLFIAERIHLDYAARHLGGEARNERR
ncbi:MAG: HD domain-containing protein [Rhodocyclaceae bacterium]|nr:HD domain-containing protein [Rhodocyclaceae bacterium]